jgi:DNA-directed RNA polymerase specialized sigma24 family protein
LVSELEKKARELDDKSMSIGASAIDVAKKLDVPFNSAWTWIRTKRAGYKDTTDYVDYRSKINGEKNYLKTILRRIINRGFLSRTEYQSYLRLKHKGIYKTQTQFFERQIKIEGSSKNLNYRNPKKLRNFPEEESPHHIPNLREQLERIIITLKPKEQEVIRKRFLECKTLNETGEDLGYTGNNKSEGPRILETRALEKLKYRAKSSGLYDLYVK